MKRILAVLAVVALVVSPVLAVDEAPAKHAAQDLTLKGKIVKTEVETKAVFTLTTTDGVKVVLPALTKEQEILDTDVEVVAKGHEVKKDGKVAHITVKEVVSVKKVEAKEAAAAAPAAPAAAAPAAAPEAPAAK